MVRYDIVITGVERSVSTKVSYTVSMVGSDDVISNHVDLAIGILDSEIMSQLKEYVRDNIDGIYRVDVIGSTDFVEIDDD